MAAPKVTIVGPSFTNYSLARVNRGLALALAQQLPGQVGVVSDSRYAERDAEFKDRERFPELANLLKPEIDSESVVIFNNFPRDPNGPYGLASLPGKLKLVYIAWEESLFPAHWIAEFNAHAHAVVAASTFVRDILIKSGLTLPCFVIHNAIDNTVFAQASDSDLKPYQLDTAKTFNFLHVSSGFPRKGTDVLIKAFAAEFNASDDVALVIKSMPNALNTAPQLVAEVAMEPNAPTIKLINHDISDVELAGLYMAAQAAAYPTRAEGFGLPIAESMLYQLPVVATEYGSHLDFCSYQTTYFVDYKLEPAAGSQLANLGGQWAEPDIASLQSALRHVYIDSGSATQRELLGLAKQNAQKLKWDSSAAQFAELIPQLMPLADCKQQNLVVISNRNDQTGIADYSQYLHTPVDSAFRQCTYLANVDVADLVTADQPNVLRTWRTGEIDFSSTAKTIADLSPDLIHIEYHSGNYPVTSLHQLLKLLAARRVVLTIHAANKLGADVTVGEGVQLLNRLQAVLVHSPQEYEYLVSQGVSTAKLFVHGNSLSNYVNTNKLKTKLDWSTAAPVIATHGLLTQNKGILQLITAFGSIVKQFPQAHLLLANALSSNNIAAQGFAEQVRSLITQLGLAAHSTFIPEFLTPNQITTLLQLSDVNILAYDDNGEAASGAVQKMIAANQPLILTDTPAFSLVKDCALVVPSNQPATLVASIKQPLNNPKEQARQAAARQAYLTQHNWHSKQVELVGVYSSEHKALA